MTICMNCGAENANHQWAGVRVCDNCKRLADKIFERNRKQLDTMFLMLKDKVRVSLLRGKL
jgi:hypothetical protein